LEGGEERDLGKRNEEVKVMKGFGRG